MNPIEVETEALKLSPEDRARIARRLLDSLKVLSETEIETLWLDEAERREQELDSGAARAIPADEVMREARARLA